MENKVRITSIQHVTHDVLKIVTDRPPNFTFIPGQATEVYIDESTCNTEKGPFTFTNLPGEKHLEFTIKTYPAHEGITSDLLKLKPNDTLILTQVFGAIAYKGEGVFIAGGAGVTPFIAILRDLQSKHQIGNNKLLFANKTKADIIYEPELKTMLGKNFIPILSDENAEGYAFGTINETFLKEQIGDIHRYFYVCGPPPMVKAIVELLTEMNVDPSHIIKEHKS